MSKIILSFAIAAIVVFASLYFDKPEAEQARSVSLESPADSAASFEYYINEKGEKWYMPEGSDGRREYNISQGGDYPKFGRAVIDPLKVVVGDKQAMLVEVYSDLPVVSVAAKIETDAGIRTIELKQTNVETAQSPARYTYEGSWVVEDTTLRTYRTTFVAKDRLGSERKVELFWSDPCSGCGYCGCTLTSSCTISSGTDGVDGGDLTLNGYTLTVNGGTFVMDIDYSINVGTGSVSMGGGTVSETYLWMYDPDSDGHAASATQTASSSSPGVGYRRRCNIVDTSDCNDANGAVWYYGYSDGDSDTYPGTFGCNNGAGSGTDCCDSDANAKPGQTSFFTSTNNCGSYDYNCDSSSEYQDNSAWGYCDDNCGMELDGCCQGGAYGWVGPTPGCGTTQSYIFYPGFQCFFDPCINEPNTQACR